MSKVNDVDNHQFFFGKQFCIVEHGGYRPVSLPTRIASKTTSIFMRGNEGVINLTTCNIARVLCVCVSFWTLDAPLLSA